MDLRWRGLKQRHIETSPIWSKEGPVARELSTSPCVARAEYGCQACSLGLIHAASVRLWMCKDLSESILTSRASGMQGAPKIFSQGACRPRTTSVPGNPTGLNDHRPTTRRVNQGVYTRGESVDFRDHPKFRDWPRLSGNPLNARSKFPNSFLSRHSDQVHHTWSWAWTSS
jgi:hypothetical protein